MSDNKTSVWSNKTARQFAEAVVAINDVSLLQNFLRDVMTEKEIIEISSRLEAARMLRAGRKYADIVAQTKLSSRTVARISDWLQNGTDGYAAVLAQIDHGRHIPPA
jgi:TrpR-related protein YerC/YecD